MAKKLDIIGNYYCYRVDIRAGRRRGTFRFTVRRCLLGQLATNRDQQYRAYAPLSEQWARWEKKQALEGITDAERDHAIKHREPVYVPVAGGFGNDVDWGRWHSCNR